MANRVWDLILKLAERTAEDKVNWERTAEAGIYQVSFPKYSVQIFARENRDRPDDIIVQVLDDTGSVVEEASDVDLTSARVNDAYPTMLTLYKNARRKAMGVEQALDAILKKLDEDPDDDLPF